MPFLFIMCTKKSIYKLNLNLNLFTLEFMYLSEITGNPIYAEKVQAIRKFLKEIEKPNGLYPNHLDVNQGRWTDGTNMHTYLHKSLLPSVLLYG